MEEGGTSVKSPDWSAGLTGREATQDHPSSPSPSAITGSTGVGTTNGSGVLFAAAGELATTGWTSGAGAAAANVPAIDTVYVDFRDTEGFRLECAEACRDGFTGKMAIHPAQVPIINEAFTPSADAIAHAQTLVAAFAADPAAGVVGIGGVMYDRPHLTRAERLLARATPAKS